MRFSRQMTNSTEASAIIDVPSMVSCSGIVPVSIVRMEPANCDRAAPPPIMMAPPKPLAVPARCGRTDNMPAVAFGITRPLPKPTKVIKPKKLSGEPRSTMKMSNDNATCKRLLVTAAFLYFLGRQRDRLAGFEDFAAVRIDVDTPE